MSDEKKIAGASTESFMTGQAVSSAPGAPSTHNMGENHPLAANRGVATEHPPEGYQDEDIPLTSNNHHMLIGGNPHSLKETLPGAVHVEEQPAEVEKFLDEAKALQLKRAEDVKATGPFPPTARQDLPRIISPEPADATHVEAEQPIIKEESEHSN